MMTQSEFNVRGMTCGGCAQGIVAALRFVPGVSSVEASHADGKVRVQYDPQQVQPAALRTEIEALEYEVVD